MAWLAGAAAKYLQKIQPGHHQVLLVGPTGFDSETSVFSSHSDQGRVVRLLGSDDFWTDLNMESAAGFQALEAETSSKIVHSTGCITACAAAHNASAYFGYSRVQDAASKFGLNLQLAESPTSAVTLARGHGYQLQGARNACYEGGQGAGYLSIPNLKSAQEHSFSVHGGVLNGGTVLKVSRTGETGENLIELTLADGSTVRAHNVLVCGGSFCNQLLPAELALPLHLKTETVVTAELPACVARELASLPSLLWEVDASEFEGVYLVPPMKYADGKWYLKIGCNSPKDMHFEQSSCDTWNQISRWFEAEDGNEATVEQERVLRSVLRDINPELYRKVVSFAPKRCIITRTPSGRPILEQLDENLFVATGGNGYGAMASDAIGRRAAEMVVRMGKAP